ncbi:MAG TPA: helix-turn-helix domain-containing protein, partial [Paracoccaceae bacterium]|nr:helix-turn-helix domain-containing protein [Paracoccaceae bacterium]
ILRAAGDGVPADRLAQLVALPGQPVPAESPALRRAVWTLRSLAALPVGPVPGLPPPARLGLPEHAGEVWLHPLVRAARIWQAGGPQPPADPARYCTAAVTAARLAAAGGRGFAAFVPAAIGGAGGAPDTPEAALTGWLAAAEAGCLAALGLLDRLSAWQSRATAATTSLNGRTPGRLIAVLATWPVVSASFAETEAQASRAAVQRNIDRLAERGLIREITGQGRYRLWTAAY